MRVPIVSFHQICDDGRNKLDVKFDSLCEGGFFGSEVGRAGLASHVGFPRIGAGFTSAAGFLFAAESTADFGSTSTDVDIGDAAVAVPLEELGFTDVGGHDGAAETLGDGVVVFDNLDQVVVGHDISDWREGFGEDGFGLLAKADEGGLDIEAGTIDSLTADDFDGFWFDSGKGRLHSDEARFVDERADEGAGFEG